MGQLVGILYLHDYLLSDPVAPFTVPLIQIDWMEENGGYGWVDHSCHLAPLMADFLKPSLHFISLSNSFVMMAMTESRYLQEIQ